MVRRRGALAALRRDREPSPRYRRHRRVRQVRRRYREFGFIPAALVTLLAGIGLVYEGPWEWTRDGWTLAGLVLFVAIFVFGVTLILPVANRVKELGAAGAPAAELQPHIERLRRLSWIDVGVLALVIFLMTVKPF